MEHKHITIMKISNILSGFILAAGLMISQLADAQTVYATEKGKKYHKKNCTVVNEGKKGIELAEAKKLGLEACSVCKPDSPADKPKTPAKKK